MNATRLVPRPQSMRMHTHKGDLRNTLTLHATWPPDNPHETILAHQTARIEEYIREGAVQNVLKLHATWPAGSSNADANAKVLCETRLKVTPHGRPRTRTQRRCLIAVSNYAT